MTITTEVLTLAAKAIGRKVESFSAEGAAWIFDPTSPTNRDGERLLRLWRPHLDGNDAGELAGRIGAVISFANDSKGRIGTVLAQHHQASWPLQCANWMEAVTLVAAAVQRARNEANGSN